MKISRQILLLAAINGLALALALSLTAVRLADLRQAFSAYAQDQALLYQLTEIKAATLAASRADLLAPATLQQLADTDQLVKSRWQALRSALPEDQAKTAEIAIMENWADFLKNFNSAIQIFASAPQDALSIPERIYPMYIAPLNQMIDQLLAQHQQTAETHRTDIQRHIDNLLWVILTPLLLAGSVMLVFQLRFGQRIRQRVDRMGSIAAQLATGDLSQRLPEKGGDEISDLAARFNHFINSFEHILHDVKHAATEVQRHAQEVAQQNRTLGEQSTRQSTELNETNRAVGEISQAISAIAHSAASASDSSSSVHEMSAQASNLGGLTAQQLAELGNSVQLAATRLSKLSEAITQIGNVSALIKDIANQTNLLALNAAIEAARAGEHGRGFAVVADEVRALSERTAESTGRIEELLQQVWHASADTVEAIRHAEQQANSSLEQGHNMASNIDETVRAIRQVSNMLDGIAAATEQHSVATGNIRELIDKASQVAQEVAGGLNFAQADLSQMQTLASRLHLATSRFQLSSAN